MGEVIEIVDWILSKPRMHVEVYCKQCGDGWIADVPTRGVNLFKLECPHCEAVDSTPVPGYP